MEPSIFNLISDIFISDYYDKKRGNALLVNEKDVNHWIAYFEHYVIKGIKKIPRKPRRHNMTMVITKDLIMNNIKTEFPIVYDILSFGNLSLCAGALVSILNKTIINDFDIFFHGVSVKEAESLLRKCLYYIAETGVSAKYSRNTEVVTVIINSAVKIQFIRRIYASKDQILLGFDLSACEHGWNPIDGYFATIGGGLSYAISAFWIDTTQRSLSYHSRLDKYKSRGFKVLLPGLPIKLGHAVIHTPDGNIITNDYNDNCFIIKGKYNLSDYDNNENHLNLLLIDNHINHNITFTSDNVNEILNLSNELVRNNILNNLCVNDIIYYRNTDEEQMVYYMYGYNKHKESDINIYVDYAFQIANIIRQNKWRHENPGGQNFG